MLRPWEVLQGDLVLSTELIMNICYHKEFLKPTFQQLQVMCGFYTKRQSFTIGGKMKIRKEEVI